ncbi:hypothetical protein EB796_005253 [Bugula neritina]|uniref:Uncharacterized protein n=1 Tax=Bugula neritina TaxID=10212 RepID=A0A7J7KG27_BUGNE|nr:hypothetical protein EB796_005253 [Bugula neritina]
MEQHSPTCSNEIADPMHVCAAETLSSARPTNPVDYSWDDPLSQAFKANVNKADNSLFEETFNLRNVNNKAIKSLIDDVTPSNPEYQSTAEKTKSNCLYAHRCFGKSICNSCN